MKIQEYTLCEDGTTTVSFNEPTVKDCFQFSDINPKLEQKAMTDYLNHMMVDDQEQNSANWTVFDRQTALVWIYVLSRDDKTVYQKYDCQHCNEEHGTPLDITHLFSNLTHAERSMSEPFEINDLKGVIVPLRGYAMEHLERLTNLRDSHPVNSKAYEMCDYDIFLYRIAYSVELEGDDDSLSPEKQADERVEKFLALSKRSGTFQQLVAKVRIVASDMRHGLPCVIREGQVLLVAEEHECPNKEGAKTRLMLPFQVIDYMPELELEGEETPY
ncbi:hypothetical protein [Vibrio europaeus]|uniref:T4 family baseplate hub assembly chaperone n=1 Tax=Vibrio europaeus TaxID=300876 RepID=UPI00233F67D6|nr:hypothetical protein [Vibrio europaeus]MDC5753623.1 hypothetical protein [Vibrio europaeus]MDC5816570.1 hypothetical protein [Vibrio europaeus]